MQAIHLHQALREESARSEDELLHRVRTEATNRGDEMSWSNQRRHRIIDIPTIPADASDQERAALAAAPELVARVRGIDGTLTIRIEDRFRPSERKVVYRFFSVSKIPARQLQNSLVATWDCYTRLLTAPGRVPEYHRSAEEATVRAIAIIETVKRTTGMGYHIREKKFKPSETRARDKSKYACRPSSGLVNRKPILEDRT